jgi:hypothetical protein
MHALTTVMVRLPCQASMVIPPLERVDVRCGQRGVDGLQWR